MTEVRRDPLSLLTGAIAAQLIGGLVPQMAPFVVSGLMAGFSLTERVAGLVSATELVSLAAAAIAIAPVLPRLSLRRIALVAVTLTFLAQVTSIFTASWQSYAVVRAMAGAGEGALYAVSLCLVASRCANPDRVYGYFQIVWALGSVVLFSIGGQATEAFGLRGVLALIACVVLAVAPLLLLIPHVRLERGDDDPLPMLSPPLLGVMTLLSIGFYFAASAALYAFSTTLGQRAGLDTRQVGYALTLATLVGLGGAGAASAIHVRWGRSIPMVAFWLTFSAAATGLCLWRHPTAYLVALAGSVAVYYFSIPYLFGLAAALDRQGRWAAAAGSAYLVGFAAGPAFGGAIIGAAGYGGLAAACIALTAGALMLALLVIRRLAGSTGATVFRSLT